MLCKCIGLNKSLNALNLTLYVYFHVKAQLIMAKPFHK